MEWRPTLILKMMARCTTLETAWAKERHWPTTSSRSHQHRKVGIGVTGTKELYQEGTLLKASWTIILVHAGLNESQRPSSMYMLVNLHIWISVVVLSMLWTFLLNKSAIKQTKQLNTCVKHPNRCFLTQISLIPLRRPRWWCSSPVPRGSSPPTCTGV